MNRSGGSERQISSMQLFASSVGVKLISVVLSFANSILINRFLGVELRGEYTVILNYANLIQLALNLGIGNTYPTFKKNHPGVAQPLFIRIIAGQTLVYLLFIVVLNIIKYTYDIFFISLLALVMMLEGQVSFIAIVDCLKQRNKVLFVTSVCYTAALGFIYIFARQNLSLILALTVLNHLISSFLYLRFLNTKGSEERILLSKKIVKEISITAIPTMLMNILMYCNYNISVIMLDLLVGNSYTLGLYGTAVTLGNMIWKVPDAFKDVLYNRAVKRDNPKEVAACIIFCMVIAISCIVIFALIGRQLLSFFYGRDFVPAYQLVQLMFIGTIPMIFYKLIHPLYIVNGKARLITIVLLSAVVANVILSIVLIPRYDAMGAAFSSVGAYGICGLIFLGIFQRDYKTNYFYLMKLIFKKIKNKVLKKETK